MDSFLSFSGIIAFFAFMTVMMSWHSSRSLSVLERWADANGYEIIDREYRNFFRGPFWMSSKGQTVYHVRVRVSSGEIRTGWVRCGGWFLGLLSDKVEVRWE